MKLMYNGKEVHEILGPKFKTVLAWSTALNAGEKWQTRDELHADFEASYVKFIGGLRTRNPAAFIVVWKSGAGESGGMKMLPRTALDACSRNPPSAASTSVCTIRKTESIA